MGKTDNYYAHVASLTVLRLKEWAAPWQKSWKGSYFGALPMNPITGRRYRAGNLIQLMLQEHADPRWLTYQQAQRVGAQVKKGEKGTPILYWTFEGVQAVPGKDGQLLQEKVELERPRCTVSYVFNAEQIEDLPAFVPDGERSRSDLERAKNILEASGARIVNRAQSSSYYREDEDTLHLPDKELFSDETSYYSTALHELLHWTGHKLRLDREFGPFGSLAYAREELRAGIGSRLLSAELGIGFSVDRHSGYVRSWIEVLEADPRELFRAAYDAEQMFDYVMGIFK